jgi:hypothetical protein
MRRGSALTLVLGVLIVVAIVGGVLVIYLSGQTGDDQQTDTEAAARDPEAGEGTTEGASDPAPAEEEADLDGGEAPAPAPSPAGAEAVNEAEEDIPEGSGDYEAALKEIERLREDVRFGEALEKAIKLQQQSSSAKRRYKLNQLIKEIRGDRYEAAGIPRLLRELGSEDEMERTMARAKLMRKGMVRMPFLRKEVRTGTGRSVKEAIGMLADVNDAKLPTLLADRYVRALENDAEGALPPEVFLEALHTCAQTYPEEKKSALADPVATIYRTRWGEGDAEAQRRTAALVLAPLKRWFPGQKDPFEAWLGEEGAYDRLKRFVEQAMKSGNEAAQGFAIPYLTAVGASAPGWPVQGQGGDLVILAKLDGEATDASENGLDGTLSGGVSFVEDGVFDQAAKFIGTEGNSQNTISFGHVKPMAQAGRFSIALWFRREVDRPDNTNHSTSNVLVSQGSDNDNDNLEIGTDGDRVEIYLDTPAEDTTRDHPAGIENEAWTHLAITYDQERKEEAHLYVNGERILAWDDWAGTLDAASASPLTIGNTHHKEAPFIGLIDEFGVWTRILTPDEIADHHAQGRAALGAGQ